MEDLVAGVKRNMDWKQVLESITESVDEEVRLRNAYLYAENCILRQQIPGRIQLLDGDRKQLAELGMKLGRKALVEIASIAKPDTILAWHRTLADQQVNTSTPRTSVGRPRIDKEIETLVVRMARENRSWGYARIVGALANLGYTISDQTVGNILKRHGIPPAPTRKKTTTWNEFIRAHMAMLVATDFFTTEVWNGFRMVLSVMCWILYGAQWMMQTAHMTALLMGRWIPPISPWSSARHARQAHMIDAALVPRWLGVMPCDAGVRRPRHAEFLPDMHRDACAKGLTNVVCLSAGHPRPIRDGPLQGRPPRGRCVDSDNREAA